MLYDNILESIGQTPLVKLHRVGSHLAANLYAKCEFMNPGGSVKDRIGYRMVADAEASGRIRPGDTLIEPTSGNTGIGIALAGAVRGYRVIITLPEKMSREKQVVLEALGAEIIRTPTEAAFDAPESHIGVAKKLQQELPNAHILDQYANPSNPQAHYETTAEEILQDLDNKVDMVVIGAGTGGTITGVAKRIKEVNPDVIIVGADPEGSILAGDGPILPYKVEGIGYDFIPDVLDRGLVDRWIKTNDRQSFLLARRLIKEEGLLCGGSCGSALQAALKCAPELKPGQNCVVMLADGVRNYMTKFVDNKWMQDNQYLGSSQLEGSVGNLLSAKPKMGLRTVGTSDSVSDAVRLMSETGISQLPVIDGRGRLEGLITEVSLLESLSSVEADAPLAITAVMDRSVPTVESDTPLVSLQKILLQSGRAIVVDDERCPKDIISKIDLVEWMNQARG